MQQKKWSILSRRKAKRILIHIRNIFVFLLLISLLYLFFAFFIKGDFFKVKTVNCGFKGKECEAKIFFNDLINKNIFLTNASDLKSKIITYFPEIKDIKVEKKLPDKLVIELIAREPIGALTSDSQVWYLIDKTGFIFKRVHEHKDIPEIKLKNIDFFVGQKITNNLIIGTIAVIQEFNKYQLPFRKILVNDNQTITVQLFDPIIASFSASKKISSQLDSLQFILRQSKIEGKLPVSVDLRFSKPVLKFN